MSKPELYMEDALHEGLAIRLAVIFLVVLRPPLRRRERPYGIFGVERLLVRLLPPASKEIRLWCS
jgi:hypothetical protein